MVFFSKGNAFEGRNDHPTSASQAITLDSGLLDMNAKVVQVVSDIEFLRIKKNLLIKQRIQKYCKEDFGLVDLFSNGYVIELGLAMNKEVICLVETIEDREVIHSELLQHAKSNAEIREWAKIPVEELQLIQSVQPVSTILEEASFCPPKENSIDTILDLSNIHAATSFLLDLERGAGEKN